MPQRFLCALAFTLTLATNLNPMTRDDDHHDGSKLTLPRFDPKDPTYFDDLQAYAQDRGLGWLLHANGGRPWLGTVELDLNGSKLDLLFGYPLFEPRP